MRVGIYTVKDMRGIIAGSSVLRGDNLVKYWPEAEFRQQGVSYDVLILQKAYDVQVAKEFKAQEGKHILILDLCDDEFDHPVVGKDLAACAELSDAITCSSVDLQERAQTRFPNKPCHFVDDRHDPDLITTKKKRLVCWFGFSDNFDVVRKWRQLLIQYGFTLRIISEKRPEAGLCDEYFVFNWGTLCQLVTECEFVINPKGKPWKSNNKTTLAWMMGMPVITTEEALESAFYYRLPTPPRNLDYVHVKHSVKELNDIINNLYVC